MAFADPQAIDNLAAASQNLARTSFGTESGGFTSSDGVYALSIQHSGNGKRKRHSIRYGYVAPVADVLYPAQNVIADMGVTLTVVRPAAGITAAQAKALADALVEWATVTSGSNLTKLIAGEV